MRAQSQNNRYQSNAGALRNIDHQRRYLYYLVLRWYSRYQSQFHDIHDPDPLQDLHAVRFVAQSDFLFAVRGRHHAVYMVLLLVSVYQQSSNDQYISLKFTLKTNLGQN